MAKQRQSSRVAPRKASKTPVKPGGKAKASGTAKATAKTAAKAAPRKQAGSTTGSAAGKRPARPSASAPAAAAHKTSPSPSRAAAPERNLAVELFEKGFRAMQQRRFAEAAEVFRAVVSEHPDEKELIDRARVYLAVCARQAAPPDATPQTFEERVYAATLSVNRGQYDESLELLTALERERPEHDHIQYMLAVVRTQRGETDEALAHLQKAFDLRPGLRRQAGQDTDLEALFDTPEFGALLDPPPSGHDRG